MVSRSFEREAQLLKALADPHRLKMLATLCSTDDEVCVCDFTDGLPLNQPTVSHHLAVLKNAGLVIGERRGTWVYYKLATDAQRRVERALTAAFKEKTLA